MSTLYSRLTCRAHNRFSPSLFLWQHFGVIERPLPHHHRLVSTAANATSGEPNQECDDTSPPEAGGAVPKNHGDHAKHPVRIHKPKTSKGQIMLPDKKSASIRKNKARGQEIQNTSLEATKQLLLYGTSGDYVGVVVEPMNADGTLRKILYPWVVEHSAGMPGMQRLALEIERFFLYTQPNEHELTARRYVAEKVQEDVREILPNRTIEIFGSERTGLALSTSDIDFRLLPQEQPDETMPAGLPPRYNERKQNIRALRKLRRELVHKSTVILTALRHARYPLVGFQDRDTGLDVQIVGSNSTSLSRDMMNKYMKEYPYLRQLYFVVKTMFDVRGLTDVFRGGFGSYPLFMMIVASLKHHPHRCSDAAGGLMNFLHFYATFDTTNTGISIDPVEMFNKKQNPIMNAAVKSKLEENKSDPLPPYLLSLRDPADETNDLGRRGVAIRHVQTTLKKLGYELQRDCKINTRSSLLEPLVGTSYMLNKLRRYKLQAYGKKVAGEKAKMLGKMAKVIRESDKEEGSP
ncbi:hypothetical protein DE146DRAFT_674804 [Phaeosphaeria sp. MPI-PUGE-AT-0046c]|nr:hypothetical protein DE146DRAFT_674804 [Phaeosphaeria sp. MPI-PUGE-AT-0046c]